MSDREQLTEAELDEREQWYLDVLDDLQQVFQRRQMPGAHAVRCMAIGIGQILQEQADIDEWQSQIDRVAEIIRQQAAWIHPHQFGH